MPTDVYIYESRCLKVYLHTVSKVKRINRGGYVNHYTIKLTLGIRTIVIIIIIIISAHKSDLSNPWSQTQASLSIPSLHL